MEIITLRSFSCKKSSIITIIQFVYDDQIRSLQFGLIASYALPNLPIIDFQFGVRLIRASLNNIMKTVIMGETRLFALKKKRNALSR